MKSKKLFIIATVIAILFLPLIAGAVSAPWYSGGNICITGACVPLLSQGTPPVPWTSEIYRAGVEGAFFDYWSPTLSDAKYGPPLPITAYIAVESYFQTGYHYSYSTITSSFIGIDNYRLNGEYDAYGAASFWGIYTSTPDAPIFELTYSYLYGGSSVWSTNSYVWLMVNDETNRSELYDNELPEGLNVISIPTIPEHTISVALLVRRELPEGAIDWPGEEDASAILTYNMGVVPEPISSILFITGGTLLAGRRLLRRKA